MGDTMAIAAAIGYHGLLVISNNGLLTLHIIRWHPIGKEVKLLCR